jgi:pimeloyl-ACP methyl ester carboxylesterase
MAEKTKQRRSASAQKFKQGEIRAAKAARKLTVRADPPDIRDKHYDAPLIPLQGSIDPPKNLAILDQGSEGACTGFGLAATIHLLLERGGQPKTRVSTRMLYEMARRHDEWPGEDYEGSSLRGALRGWNSMGVCTEKAWPYDPEKTDAELTIVRAKEAKKITLGAYFRLRPHLPDYHAALCQAEVIYVSADVHEGWSNPGRNGVIKYTRDTVVDGGHAFAIVGYNDAGFWVQNSWGTDWGRRGLALWTYEDWLDNVVDAWAVRLALPVPQVFGLTPRTQARRAAERPELFRDTVKRGEIAGHFAHVDDGKFAASGEYWSTAEDVRQTAELVAKSDAYDHLLIYAHGGLNSPLDAAKRIRAFKAPFKRNKIYPYSIMYDTGLAEEIKDVLLNARDEARGRAGGFRDFLDRMIEDLARKPVTPLWEEMKRDARIPFDRDGDGAKAVESFVAAFGGTNMKIHLVGHSTGAVLLGHLLAALDRAVGGAPVIASCTLLAPACTMDFFKEMYRPRLGKGAEAGKVPLPKMRIYNLADEAEQDDNVAAIYGKSLLYLVSRALERAKDKPLLGLARDCQASRLAGVDGLDIVYAAEGSSQCACTSHGGFDNDLATMNGVMRLILGKAPDRPFTAEELKGY